MPVRIVRIVYGIHAFRVDGVPYIEQYPISRTRPSGQPDLRKDRDVVALVGFDRPSAGVMRARTLQSVYRTRCRIAENARCRYDLSVLRCGQRNLDHLDAKPRRIRILISRPA